jgi:hypothetical protein
MGWRRLQALGNRQQAALLGQSGLRHGGGRLPKVSECTDPRALGVHAAVRPAKHVAGQQRGAPGAVPPYVPRDADDSALLADGFASGGLVIIEGPAAAGKTRMAYEAMRRRAPGRQLIVPGDPAALRGLQTAGVRLADTIVWLDDIHDYLAAGGLDGPVVDALCPPGRRDVLLLATLRSEARRTLDAAGLDTTVRRAIREVVGRARVIPLSRALTPAERHRAQQRRTADPRIAAALDQHTGAGFAEFLAAAPPILHRWQSVRDSTGGAIITAAVDARRAGVLSPLPRDLLQALHACYLDARHAHLPGEPGFGDALSWATQPVRGASSCLAPLGGETYEPFDYLLEHAQATGSAHPVPPAAWPVLLTCAAPADMSSLAIAAHEAGRPDISETAFRRAADAGDASSMCNLGVLLDAAGRRAEAARWFRQAAGAGHVRAICHLGLLLDAAGRREEAEEWLRQAAGAGDADAMCHLGALLDAAGRREDAEEWLRQAVGAGHIAALDDLGALLEEMGRHDEAGQWYRQAADAGHTGAMDRLGVLLHEMGRAQEAEHWYRQAADAGHASAMDNLGALLHEMGRAQQAEHWYRQAAATGHTGAKYNLGALLEQADRPEEAEEWYRQAADAGHTGAMNHLGALLHGMGRVHDAERRYQQAAATGDTAAMYHLGALLHGMGRVQDAEHWYRQAAATGHTGAMHNLGTLLDETGRHQEAEQWYRQADTKHRAS